jgi:hypothetical protein
MKISSTTPQYWDIYLLPNQPKVGMSTKLSTRLKQLDCNGIDISGVRVLDRIFGTWKDAEAVETYWQEIYDCVDLRSQSTRNKLKGGRTNSPNIEWHTRKPITGSQKEIMQFDLDMRLVAVYTSVSVAANVNDVSVGAISSALTGRQRTCAGSLWMFVPEHFMLPASVYYIH